jgi:hypothetical protein
MRNSHKKLRLFLRIIYCFSIWSIIYVFIYELFIARHIFHTIFNLIHVVVIASILYILFARRSPSIRFVYGSFYGMCIDSVLRLLINLYETWTIKAAITHDLIEHIEKHRSAGIYLRTMISLNKYVRWLLLFNRTCRCSLKDAVRLITREIRTRAFNVFKSNIRYHAVIYS